MLIVKRYFTGVLCIRIASHKKLVTLRNTWGNCNLKLIIQINTKGNKTCSHSCFIYILSSYSFSYQGFGNKILFWKKLNRHFTESILFFLPISQLISLYIYHPKHDPRNTCKFSTLLDGFFNPLVFLVSLNSLCSWSFSVIPTCSTRKPDLCYPVSSSIVIYFASFRLEVFLWYLKAAFNSASRHSFHLNG